MYIHNFWRCLERWGGVVRTRKEFYCGKCYLPYGTCFCEAEQLPYAEVLEELGHWMGVNIMKAYQQGNALVHENPGYDRDYVYPKPPPLTPGPVQGQAVILPDEPYRAYIVRGERVWYYDGQSIESSTGDYEQGITWGHKVGDRFYPLARYAYPYWIVCQTVKPPSGIRAAMLHNVPNTEVKICL